MYNELKDEEKLNSNINNINIDKNNFINSNNNDNIYSSGNNTSKNNNLMKEDNKDKNISLNYSDSEINTKLF